MRRLAAASMLMSLALAGAAFAKPGKAPKAGAPAAQGGASAGASASTTPAPSVPASAASGAAPDPSPGTPAVPAGTVGGCVESVPSGAARPVVSDTFPARGISGYEATLRIVVEHGRGETVLPRGLELQSESDAAKALREAGFVLPDQDGGAGARVSAAPADSKHPDRATTVFELPLLALPPEPGRHTLTLPPLPVAVARANGEIATVCTKPHTLVVDEPTASTPNAAPKPNPPPRAQREDWTFLRQMTIVAAIALVVGILLAILVRKWLARPKRVPPPPPPRPPWEVALEKLDEVRYAGLLEVGRFQEYFDRVNDAVRQYLGARYGFDGLESTTDEILKGLRHALLESRATEAIVAFLKECDLVKFANVTPSKEECERTLGSAERIVRTTMPMGGAEASGPATGGGGPAAPAGDAGGGAATGPAPAPPPPSPSASGGAG